MAHLVIDGYNLIRTSKVLAKMDSLTLEKGRHALAARLAAYKKIKGHRITLVFDGGGSDHTAVNEEKLAGIRTLYSPHGVTADEIIIQIAQKMGSQIIVVSSDNQILSAARQAGCGILQIEDFEQKLSLAALYSEKGPTEEAPAPQRAHKRWATQKKGPSKRLPKAKRKAMAKLKEL